MSLPDVAFSSVSEFFAMGGHALYVWSAWGLTATCLAGLVIATAAFPSRGGGRYPPPPASGIRPFLNPFSTSRASRPAGRERHDRPLP